MPNPGSYNEFLAREGLQPGPEAIEAHSVALDGFKEEIARRRGFTDVADLHTMPIIPLDQLLD